jgi:hypothetical protein
MTLRGFCIARRKPFHTRKVLAKRALRVEMLETRALMSAAGVGQALLAVPPAASASAAASQPANPAIPSNVVYANALVAGGVSGVTIQRGATATPLTVTGTTTTLVVQGTENGSGAGLIYTWTTTDGPSADVTFSRNGTATAKSTVAKFPEAGTYELQATIADTDGRSVTSIVSVTVRQTLKTIVITPGSVHLNENQTQPFTAAENDQFGNVLAAPLKIKWAKTVGVGSISTSGMYTSPAGVGSAEIAAISGLVVGRASVKVTNAPPTVLTPAMATPATVTGTTTTLSVTGADDGGEPNLTYKWAAVDPPAKVVFSASGTNAAQNTQATFSGAGTYTFQVTITDKGGLSVTSPVTVVVSQTLTSLTITPSSLALAAGATQQFTTLGLDQFGNALAPQPTVAWSAVGGDITSDGLFTAPQTTGAATVTAASGTLAPSAAVFVLSGNFPVLKDVALAEYVQSLDAAGSISRIDMIDILEYVAKENGGVLSSNDFSDLKTIVADAAVLNMPNYVQVLAGDVVDGNAANARFQGKPLGNLAVGSTATHLTELVDKWFLGMDHPALTSRSYTYQSFAGDPLFNNGGPTIYDEGQGYLGDCYLISALGSIANASQSSIENMFIDNGDGTYTVRFYYDPSGSTNAQADYVTVDSMLPVYYGSPVYSGLGAGNSLWLPLAEKAYAQWNATGNEISDNPPANSYNSIQGGWMDAVYQQVLGTNSQDYGMDPTGRAALIAAMSNPAMAVTIGTNQNIGNPDPNTGLYSDHAYAIIGYNSANGTFQLYNPWGVDQPNGWLTWDQLCATCTGMSLVNTADAVTASAATATKPGAGARAADLCFANLENSATQSPLGAARFPLAQPWWTLSTWRDARVP